MSLEHWEGVKRKEGNTIAANLAEFLRNQFGDVPPLSLADKLKSDTDPIIQALAPTIAAIEALLKAKNSSSTLVIPKVDKEPESAKPEVTEVTEVIEVLPENPFDLEWQAQARRYVELGFDKELGYKTPEEYTETLPEFGVQPEGYNIPLIVEPRIFVRNMALLLDINKGYASSDVDHIGDWGDDEFKVPKVPYSTWVSVEISNSGKSIKEIRGVLKADERWGNIFDGLALYLKDPKILDDCCLVFPGSRVYSNSVPILYRDNEGVPVLKTLSVEDSYMGLLKPAFVVAGRKIKV